MKKTYLILLIMLSVAFLLADNQWNDEGIPIRKGVNIEWTRAAAATSDGGVVYVWSDTRIGDRDLWAQKVSSEGNVLWGESSNNPGYPEMVEGLLVNDEINRQEDPVIIANEDGSVIIAWVDFRYQDSGDIFAQKLDQDGNLVWAEEGVPICLADDIQISLNIVNDAAGGAYIIWQDARNPGGADIYGTHILTDGTIAAGWDVNGNPIASEAGSQDQHTFWEDGQGGAIVVWHDTRNPDDENLYMQRMNAAGDLLWDTNGTLLTNAAGTQVKAKITPLNDGNFFIGWRDKRNDDNGDIYSQKIDLNGNFLWDNEVIIYEGEGIQQNPRVTQSSDGGAFVTWEDGRFDMSFKEIFIQKIDTNGNLLWNTDGVVVCDELNDQLNPRLVGDENGGTVVIWDDGRVGGHPNENIYIQHFDSDGNIAYQEDGFLICDAYSEQFSPLIKKGATGEYFVNWGDWRTGSVGIFFQIIDTEGNMVMEDNGEIIYYGLNGDALNFQLIENGDNAIIVWEDTRFSSIANQIYMQTINVLTGDVNLEKDGIPITNMSNHNQVNMDVIYAQDEDILGLIWEENRSGQDKQIFAQGVDSEGNFIWSDDTGVIICTETASQQFPAISKKEIGGEMNFFAGWSDYRNWMTGSAIYGQRITADGTLLWGEEGILIADGSSDDELNDVVEDYYIWHGGTWPAQDLYVKRVDENGNTAAGWPDDGLVLCDADGFQENARGMMIPEGLLIVWEDKRSGTIDLYGQVVTADGNFLWADNGVPITDAPNDQKSLDMLYDDDIYMVWEDFRTGNDEDIYAYAMDETGSGLWTDNGQEVAVKDSAQTSPSLVKTEDNIFVFWQDNLSQEGSILFGQLLDLDGNPLWEADGTIICDDIKNQNKPQSCLTSDQMAFVIWEDTRSSGKTDIYNIYAQKVSADPSASDDDFIPTNNNVLQQNYPNPFNPETTIKFSVPEGYNLDDMKLNIYNLKGQLVKSYQPNSNFVNWNGVDSNNLPVANGLYFYRLEAKGYSSNTRKMILLK